mmetsp:Transcript_38510/g.46522  ORF Transcript_38510/g.46522 Transcript_38510/m.46522 type:complete len:155 (-) Transcript_38510:781-1245(-)|eukprot:CAMPEP_0197847848 /NCGR_PEP_ID=MMETSP1438-20131217/7268_1 /TAXON_ID=1461541 /ORGANISM="Pterosperma sp., Strain CCMP1384" /LENGTH=154 /DNA_ID=CAMNT_0043459889 /DNA_START=258 /DNA_END=722 /DNA_ORIENTATION=+
MNSILEFLGLKEKQSEETLEMYELLGEAAQTLRNHMELVEKLMDVLEEKDKVIFDLEAKAEGKSSGGVDAEAKLALTKRSRQTLVDKVASGKWMIALMKMKEQDDGTTDTLKDIIDEEEEEEARMDEKERQRVSRVEMRRSEVARQMSQVPNGA